MRHRLPHTARLTVPALSAGLLLLAIAACTAEQTIDQPWVSAPATQPESGQAAYATPDLALAALVEAVKAHDRPAMHQVLGPSVSDLLSGDKVEDANDFKDFAGKCAQKTRLEPRGDAAAVVHVGQEDWPFPIPLTRAADGQWFFNTPAGKEEVLVRRIGGNELETIRVCRAYVQAQREYASQDRDGSQVLQYAQRLVSHPGQKDGLYWQADPGQEQSPFGPLTAQAALEGYGELRGRGAHPFHGYYFHILKAQGPAAPAGAYDYVINGHMIAGFALVACPDRYGYSGIMTFIISHQGRLYEQDLGPDTLAIVKKMREYNPDSGWQLVKD